MTPWLWASSLFAASSEEEEEEEESLRLSALGLGAGTGTGRQGRSVFEMFVDRQDEEEGVVYTVEISDGYVLRAFGDYSTAVEAAERQVSEQLNVGDADDVMVFRFEHVPDRLRTAVLLHGVPYPEWRKRILDGRHDDFKDFGDGYEAGHALVPYLSTEIDPDHPRDPGLSWKWQIHDERFEDWPEGLQEEHREQVFRDSRSEIPLSAGLRLYLRTSEPSPFEDAVGRRGILDEPVVVSTNRAKAPVDPIAPQDEAKGTFVVMFEVKETVQPDRIVVAPWGDESRTDELGEMLGEAINPRHFTDLEDVSRKATAQHEHFEVLLVETDEHGNALLFFDPGHEGLPIEVVSVEQEK